MRKETKGTILALMTALVSGFAIVINKFFVVQIDPYIFTAMRALVIGLIFFIAMTYLDKRPLLRLNKNNVGWKHLLFIGLVGGGMAFLMFFSGLQLTTAGRAAFLHKTLPLYATALAFVFLKEKVTRKQVYSMLFMLLGTMFILWTALTPDVALGDLLIIGATVLWACENVVARGIMKKGETNLMVSFSRMFLGALLLFAFIGIAGKLPVLLALTGQQLLYITVSAGMLLMYVLFWYWSLKLINISKATTLLLLAPVISLIAGWAVLGERVMPVQLVGSAMILVGAWVVARTKSEKRTMATGL